MDGDLLGHVRAALLGLQLWHQLGDVLAGSLWLQAALLLWLLSLYGDCLLVTLLGARHGGTSGRAAQLGWNLSEFLVLSLLVR